jgi:hypothetical protein
VSFRLVIDVTWAILMEVYQDYGMKFDDAMEELNKRLTDPTTPEGAKVRAPDDAASMAVLQAMMGGTDFGGPRG